MLSLGKPFFKDCSTCFVKGKESVLFFGGVVCF